MRYLLLYTAWAVGTPADSIPTEQNWGMDDFESVESAFSKLKSSVTGSESPAENSSKTAKLKSAAAAALHQAQKHASNALHAAQNAASDKLHQSQTSAVQKFGFGDLQTAFSNFTQSAKVAYHGATDTAEEAYHKAGDKATAAFHENEDNGAQGTPATPPLGGDNEDEASEAFRQAQDEASAEYRAAHNAAHRQYQHALNEISQQWDFASLRKQFLGNGTEETPAKAPAPGVETNTEQKWDFPDAADLKKGLLAAKKKAMAAYHSSRTEASNNYHEAQKKATSDYHAKQGEAATKTEEKWGFDDLKKVFGATSGTTSETTSESDTLDQKSDEAAKRAAEQERTQHKIQEERAKAELEEEAERAKEEARQEEERAKEEARQEERAQEEARQEEERAKQELKQEQHRAKVESEAGEEAENKLREAASQAAESEPEPSQPPEAPKGISLLNQEILQASHFHADPNSPIKIVFYMSSGGEGSETFYREQLEGVLENPGIPTQLELIPQFDKEDIGSSDGECSVCANGDERAQQECKANLVLSIVELEDTDEELRNRIYHALIQPIPEPTDGSEDFWVHAFEGNDKLAEMKSMIKQKLLDCEESLGVIRGMRQKFEIGIRDAEEQLRHFGLPEASKTIPYVFVDDILLPLHEGSLHLEDSKLASLDDVLCEMNPNSKGCKVKESIARYSVFRGPELNVCLQNLALVTAALLLSVIIVLWLRVTNRRRYHISTEADVLLEEPEEP